MSNRVFFVITALVILAFAVSGLAQVPGKMIAPPSTLVRTPGHGMDALPAHPVMRRWWDYMKDIMASNPDGSPLAEPLASMFHMD